MVIAGAALIKGAKSQKITSLDIGGPEVHVHQSGCADVRVPDDETLLACIRRDVARLPSSGADFYRGDLGPIDPRFAAGELAALIPSDHREAYDANQVLARLVRSVAVLGGHARGRRGDDLRRRPRRRALRRLRDQPPGPRRRSRASRPAAPVGHPVSRRHREDQRVLARVQRRRHPADLAAGHLRLRHRPRGRGARPARVRQLADLHELDEHDADVHRAAAQGVGRRLLRDERPALRSDRPAVDQLRAAVA